jgi:hypothetical protein
VFFGARSRRSSLSPDAVASEPRQRPLFHGLVSSGRRASWGLLHARSPGTAWGALGQRQPKLALRKPSSCRFRHPLRVSLRRLTASALSQLSTQLLKNLPAARYIGLAPCVDGSELARKIFASHRLVGAGCPTRSRSRRERGGLLVALTLGHHGPRHSGDLLASAIAATFVGRRPSTQ